MKFYLYDEQLFFLINKEFCIICIIYIYIVLSFVLFTSIIKTIIIKKYTFEVDFLNYKKIFSKRLIFYRVGNNIINYNILHIYELI